MRTFSLNKMQHTRSSLFIVLKNLFTAFFSDFHLVLKVNHPVRSSIEGLMSSVKITANLLLEIDIIAEIFDSAVTQTFLDETVFLKK
jgi:hypothetical protein